MSTITSVSELDALPGLTAAKRTLKGIFAQDADVHAVLFYGEEGAGKSQLANFLTRNPVLDLQRADKRRPLRGV
jgi:hypothetical protein